MLIFGRCLRLFTKHTSFNAVSAITYGGCFSKMHSVAQSRSKKRKSPRETAAETPTKSDSSYLVVKP